MQILTRDYWFKEYDRRFVNRATVAARLVGLFVVAPAAMILFIKSIPASPPTVLPSEGINATLLDQFSGASMICGDNELQQFRVQLPVRDVASLHGASNCTIELTRK